MNKLITFIAMISFLVFVGCGTIQGVGRDVEKVGEVIQKSTR